MSRFEKVHFTHARGLGAGSLIANVAARLRELLVRAIVDPKAAKHLKRIADATPPPPKLDFG